MSKSILWISPFVPYDTIGHAGGKNHNFHIKYLNNIKHFDIFLISQCMEKEVDKLDIDKYEIPNRISVLKENKKYLLLRYLVNIESTFNPFQKYCGLFPNNQMMALRKNILEYKRLHPNANPSIIILQWTQVLLLLPLVKKCFPRSKFVVIEEDVAYLGYLRKRNYSKNIIKKAFYNYRYNKLKELELKNLSECDHILLNNIKDLNLLQKEGIPIGKLHQIAIYFDDYSGIVRKQKKSRNIVFFGAMKRSENYLSAIWFIENVLPLLEDYDVTFSIIGSGPGPNLKKYIGDRVKILGFVPDVTDEFSTCLCLAAPLLLGAGIKVKILEAMSAGIPVLTNDIGIEGIPAIDGKDYLHCTSPEEYAAAVISLIDNKKLAGDLSNNGRDLLKREFNTNQRMQDVVKVLEET